MNDQPLLLVDQIRAGYTEEDVLKGVSLEVYPGEVVCVIGPNGAGKSTVFKAIYGFIPVRSGRIVFDGTDISDAKPQEVLAQGMSIVPQLHSIFPQMSVKENLELGLYLERDRRRVVERIDEVLEMFPRLAERSGQMAGTLSGGERRMLEIGRALMIEPKLILMDEPSAGLAPFIVSTVFDHIRGLNERLGLTVLMIEQNARRGLETSDRGYVLELGRNSYEGTGEELLDDREVRQAFLGVR